MKFTFARRTLQDIPENRRQVVLTSEVLQQAKWIVEDVRQRGEAALYEHAIRLGDLREGDPLVIESKEMKRSLRNLDRAERGLLERTAKRIQLFARAQKKSLSKMSMVIPGGRAGHVLSPVERVGCYAPGGRFPLPSTVLMTVLTAREAGVKTVWVASPRPTPITLAAASLAGADALLAVGGAQAIAALAYGCGPVPASDLIVGPGNKWVTAAKKIVAGEVAIDMLAGPTELVILADRSADPATLAADLLAQAEHDPDATPILVSLDEKLIAKVEQELQRQLVDLPTAEIARQSLRHGFCVVVKGIAQAIAICNRLAPEHLELMLRNSNQLAKKLDHYGALFIGSKSAEVLGDYGVGPNHVLPTGRAARFTGGLSVFHFLRVRSWMDLKKSQPKLLQDAAAFARLEGLEAHARAAEIRLKK